MSRILLATRSTHKAKEIRRIVGRTGVQLVTPAELDIPESPEEDAVENRDSFLGNAIAKAAYFSRLTSLPALADDSGLEVAALGNRPGVRTRRFAIDAGRADLAGEALDRANNELLLDRLREVPAGNRNARYVCAVALADPQKHALTALGTCAGEIALEPRGFGGFGYDPLFFIPSLGVTFAELTPEQKDERSHRARATRAIVQFLAAFG